MFKEHVFPAKQDSGRRAGGRAATSLLRSTVIALLLFSTRAVRAQQDCCTPDATARIAAASSFIEIAGIKLGTPAKEAVAILQAHEPKVSIEPPAIIHVDLLPGVDFVTGLGAGTLDSGGPGNRKLLEEVQLALTPPPSEPVVWGISYRAVYPSNARPTCAGTIAQLRNVYGPESGTTKAGSIIQELYGVETVDAYWVFDAAGKLLPEKDAAEFYRFCAEYSPGVKVTLTDTSFVSGRGEWREPRAQNNCGNNTVVTAAWDPTEPSMGELKGLIRNLKIEGANGLLHRSSYEATYAMEVQAARRSR